MAPAWMGDYTGDTQTSYEAYCFYVPTGIGEDFEKPLLDKLKAYGIAKKNLVLVADWDPGHESYNELLRTLHLSPPAIIFSDSKQPTADTFNVVVDKLNLIKDIQMMTTEIPQLCQLIVNKEYAEAVKRYAGDKKREGLRRLINGISPGSKHFNVTVSFLGVSLNVTL